MLVLNKGRCGDSSSLLLKKLQKDIINITPNMIVVMVGANDYWNLEDSNYFLLKNYPMESEYCLYDIR